MLLLTESVLHSPWVLQEVHQCWLHALPLVPVSMSTHWEGTVRSGLAFLATLEQRVQSHEAHAADTAHDRDAAALDPTVEATVSELRRYCEALDTPVSVAECVKAIRTKLDLERVLCGGDAASPTTSPRRRASISSEGLPYLQVMTMEDSDKVINAAVTALVERMAFVTGREPPLWTNEGTAGESLAKVAARAVCGGNSGSGSGGDGDGGSGGGSGGSGGLDDVEAAAEAAHPAAREGLFTTVWRAFHGEPPSKLFSLFLAHDLGDERATRAAHLLQMALQLQSRASLPLTMEESRIETANGRIVPFSDAALASADVLEREGRIRKLLDRGVACSEGLLLLQTHGVFKRPATLLILYEALRLNIPVTPILIVDGGYDYPAMKAKLTNLEEELTSSLSLEEVKLIERLLAARHNATLRDLQLALSKSIPYIISLQFDPDAPRAQLVATLDDIADRVMGGAAASQRNPANAPTPPPLANRPSAPQGQGANISMGWWRSPPPPLV